MKHKRLEANQVSEARPVAGKSKLAGRRQTAQGLPGILQEMSRDEAMEIKKGSAGDMSSYLGGHSSYISGTSGSAIIF